MSKEEFEAGINELVRFEQALTKVHKDKEALLDYLYKHYDKDDVLDAFGTKLHEVRRGV